MTTLYNIANEYRELLDMLQSAEIEEQTILDTIESTGLKDNFNDKIDDYLYVIDELEAVNERIRNEEKRLAKRRTTQAKNVRKMKDILTDTMELLEIQKTKTDKYTVWVQNNPLRLQVEDESFVPQEFYEEQKPKLNLKKLTDYLKGGNEVKGVSLTQSKGIRKR